MFHIHVERVLEKDIDTVFKAMESAFPFGLFRAEDEPGDANDAVLGANVAEVFCGFFSHSFREVLSDPFWV